MDGNERRYLTTGVRSGLGWYLHREFGGAGLSRQTAPSDFDGLLAVGADVIIHSAFNPARDVNDAELAAYMNDNVFLTAALTAAPHRKFVYISSIEVYPKDGALHAEDEPLAFDPSLGMYRACKLMSESLVRNRCPNHLILRCVSLLGESMRRNSIVRILDEEACSLTVTGDSEFNFVRYADVADFIRLAAAKDLRGIYNVSSTGNITMSEAAQLAGKQVSFGAFRYEVGRIDNRRAAAEAPVFRQSSKDALLRFIADRKENLERERHP